MRGANMKIDKSGDGWQMFLELCSKVKGQEDFNNLFALFLTYEERETLAFPLCDC